MHTVIIGSPGDVRVTLFQQALLEQQHQAAEIVSYTDLIHGRKNLRQIVRQRSVIRIESPGKDEVANQALLEIGATQPDNAGAYARITPANIPVHIADKGRIVAPRQWYLGLCAFLGNVQSQLADCPPHRLMNHPDDIALMFDKCLCHNYLDTYGISVPRALPSPVSFDDLHAQMQQHNLRRVFIKPAHGSSASGVIAYQTDGNRHQATAAIEMVSGSKTLKLYNTRRIRQYNNLSEIAMLIDAICQHRVHVEQWIPKARIHGKAFDLRVIVVDGKAAHVIARLSDSPMTNLHLLNERQHRDVVLNVLGDDLFEQVMALCEHAMCYFPKSFYAGIDVVVASGKTHPCIIEMNAFGDLLKNTFYHGLSPYALEIQRMAHHEHA